MNIMMLDDIKAYETSSVEPWVENFGESGCLEPIFKKNNNYDDEVVEDKTILSWFLSAAVSVFLLTGLPFRILKCTKGLQKLIKIQTY